jgi:hypothetical protein
VDGAAERPVVGFFGAFDTGELGEVALRRVVESELGRLRPDIDLIALAPFGAERPIPGDEGRPALPLPNVGGETPHLDALIVTGDVLGDDHQWATRYPVAGEAIAERGVEALVLTGTLGGRVVPDVSWFAVGALGEGGVGSLSGRDVWARDQATQEWLGGTAVQSGDPLLLTCRVFPADALRRRADLLRMCGALPAGRRLVIEIAPSLDASPSCEPLVAAVAAAMRADPKLSVVVADLDPTRQPPAGPAFTLPGLLPERVHHLPVWVGLDDIAATMSGSAAMIATSPAGAHIGASLGVPVAAFETGLGRRFDASIPMLAADVLAAVKELLAAGHPARIGPATRTLEGAFAELAERLPRAPGVSRASIDPDGVRSALTILQQRLVDERTALQAELSRVQSELDHLRAAPEHRITRPIREGYQRWQRRRT